MKNIRWFAVLVVCLVASSVLFIYGCGNATGGGGGGGGGDGSPFTADKWVSTTGGTDTATGTYGDPYKTIQKALKMIGMHETIGVFAGVYKENLTWTTREGVTLRGISMSTVTLDAQSLDRGILMSFQSTGAPASIEYAEIIDMTITNGFVHNTENGAGIYFDYTRSILKLTKVCIENCSIETGATNSIGGAAYVADTNYGLYASMEAKNCIIRNNNVYTTSGGGGGLYILDAIISSCEIYNNSSDFGVGGGIYANGSLVIFDTTIRNNHSGGYGGAIAASGPTGIISCNIINNHAGTMGGAMYCGGSNTLNLLACTFENNTSESSGGAIYMDAAGIVATGCAFEKNIAATDGGGIYANDEAYLYRCSIKYNTAEAGVGGGMVINNGGRVENCLIYHNGGSWSTLLGAGMKIRGNANPIKVVNCTFSFHDADEGASIYTDPDATSASNVMIKNCIMWNSSAHGGVGDWDHLANSSDSSMGNITVSHCDIDEGVPMVGTKNTTAEPAFEEPDLHLNTMSSIEVTRGGTTVDAPAVDFDGNLRTPPYSIGAYEYDL